MRSRNARIHSAALCHYLCRRVIRILHNSRLRPHRLDLPANSHSADAADPCGHQEVIRKKSVLTEIVQKRESAPAFLFI